MHSKICLILGISIYFSHQCQLVNANAIVQQDSGINGSPCYDEVRDCFKASESDCLSTNKYAGSKTTTRQGIVCQDWSMNTPHAHNFTSLTLNLTGNLCSNPNNKRNGVWCYTTDPSQIWDYCYAICQSNFKCYEVVNEQLCLNNSQPECLGTQNYIGSKSITKSNLHCQEWASTYPHNHHYTNLPGARCSNPDGDSGGAWCFTKNPSVQWEYCFPKCHFTCYNAAKDCFISAQPDCLGTQSYKGSKSVTRSGIPCQYWFSNFPHSHRFTNLLGNSCSNPNSGVEGAWCYTTKPSVRWEYCFDNCPICYDDANDCFDNAQPKCLGSQDYYGTKSVTRSGLPCQMWSLSYPHSHQYTNLPGNSCSNPDGKDEGAWCYTTDPSIRWEYCFYNCHFKCYDAANDNCFENNKPECENTNHYNGPKSVTKTGLTCQKWASDSPHSHDFNDGPGNRCSNPSGANVPAWCYTTDPSVFMDFCFYNCHYKCYDASSDCFKRYLPNCLGTNSYHGPKSVTRSGLTCQTWALDSPHSHDFNYLRGNSCSNPDGEDEGAWCFTTNPSRRWEYCFHKC